MTRTGDLKAASQGKLPVQVGEVRLGGVGALCGTLGSSGAPSPGTVTFCKYG